MELNYVQNLFSKFEFLIINFKINNNFQKKKKKKKLPFYNFYIYYYSYYNCVNVY